MMRYLASGIVNLVMAAVNLVVFLATANWFNLGCVVPSVAVGLWMIDLWRRGRNASR